MPQLLRDLIVRALAQAPNINVVGTAHQQPIIRIAHETEADVIIIAESAEAHSSLVDSLLAGCPRASVVVVVDADADHADTLTRFELWPRAVDFDEPSKEHLLRALRSATPWAQRTATQERLAL